MIKLASRCAALLALASIAGVAQGQSANQWDGPYAGVNAGSGANTTCNSWTLNGALIDPSVAAAF